MSKDICTFKQRTPMTGDVWLSSRALDWPVPHQEVAHTMSWWKKVRCGLVAGQTLISLWLQASLFWNNSNNSMHSSTIYATRPVHQVLGTCMCAVTSSSQQTLWEGVTSVTSFPGSEWGLTEVLGFAQIRRAGVRCSEMVNLAPAFLAAPNRVLPALLAVAFHGSRKEVCVILSLSPTLS